MQLVPVSLYAGEAMGKVDPGRSRRAAATGWRRRCVRFALGIVERGVREGILRGQGRADAVNVKTKRNDRSFSAQAR